MAAEYRPPITAATQAALDGKQPVDSDLTAIAALSTTAYGRAFLALADAAAGRTALGLGTAATQATGAFDPAGAATAAQAAAIAASQPADADLAAIAALTTTAFGRGLLTLADAAALLSASGGASASALAAEITARTDADALLAPLASPALTGNPTVPTQTAGNNSTRAASTAFVGTAVAAHVDDASDAHDASAVSVAGLASLTGSDVQAVLANVDTRLATVESSRAASSVNLRDHLRSVGWLPGDPDASAGLASALATGKPVRIPYADGPDGEYLFAAGIVLGDGAHLIDDGGAVLKAHASLAGVFVRNADQLGGNTDITLEGGIYDANAQGRGGSAANIQLAVSMVQGGTGNMRNVHVVRVEGRNAPSINLQITRCQSGSVDHAILHDSVRDGLNFSYDCADIDVTALKVWNAGDDNLACNAENQTLATTGTIDLGTPNEVTVASTAGAFVGYGIGITGAGVAGAKHYSTITAVAGNVIQIADPAVTAVSGVGVIVGTVGHYMGRFNIVAPTLLGPAEAGQLGEVFGGGCMSLSGLQDSTILAPVCRDGNHGIAISNFNTTPARNLKIVSATIERAGRLWTPDNVHGEGISISAANSTHSTSGVEGVYGVELIAPNVRDSKYFGIHALSQGGKVVRDLKIIGGRTKNAGFGSGTTRPGLVMEGVENFTEVFHRSTDDQAVKTQSIGAQIVNPVGRLILMGNNHEGNATAGSAGFYTITGSSGASGMNVTDVPGYLPFAGVASITGAWSAASNGAWSGFSKSLAVTFLIPFPTGAVPTVVANPITSSLGISAQAVSVTNTGCTIRLWSSSDPGSGTHQVQWKAFVAA